MLSENDLICKIAEYRCRNTITESDCVKLAAFITIRDCLYPKEDEYQTHSFSNGPAEPRSENTYVSYDSNSQFFMVANGMETDKVWKVVDELMDALQVINPRLYTGVIQKLEEG